MAGKKRLPPSRVERPSKRKEIEEEKKSEEESDSFSASNEKAEDSFDSDFDEEGSPRSKGSDKPFDIEEYKKWCSKDKENQKSESSDSESYDESASEDNIETQNKREETKEDKQILPISDAKETKALDGKKEESVNSS